MKLDMDDWPEHLLDDDLLGQLESMRQRGEEPASLLVGFDYASVASPALLAELERRGTDLLALDGPFDPVFLDRWFRDCNGNDRRAESLRAELSDLSKLVRIVDGKTWPVGTTMTVNGRDMSQLARFAVVRHEFELQGITVEDPS